MRKLSFLLVPILALAFSGCESRTDKRDTGGVVLSITDFDGLPVSVGVNAAAAGGGLVQIGSLTIQNIAADLNAPTSQLMNVEIQSYEVRYSRADSGTALPPPFVRNVLGVAPVNGTETYENLPIMSLEQIDNQPLSDLQFINGGFDKETGSDSILLNFEIRFFGRTLTGDAVDTAPAGFTIQFVP